MSVKKEGGGANKNEYIPSHRFWVFFTNSKQKNFPNTAFPEWAFLQTVTGTADVKKAEETQNRSYLIAQLKERGAIIMNYNFDEVVSRLGTNSIKLEVLPEGAPKDILSLWVADMDFPCAEPII